MAATWSIENTVADTETNRLLRADWKVTDKQGDVVGWKNGSTDLTEKAKDDPWDTLQPAQVIAWVKSEIGGEAVAAAETEAAQNREKKTNPKTKSGLPPGWVTEA